MISAGLFSDCKNLKEVICDGEIKTIESFAFGGCEKLEIFKDQVDFKGLESVEDDSFKNTPLENYFK